ncbi:hypothetical protein TPHA_0C04660 [Tetrapisispora phaffii CBS 4417]|uniref:Peptide chain release factor 1, mitochondrial n=1 Tax=Tetrapisispora phaffii (strain ATCC 24235 / CBS 4417 / NBRC 1672 / NRRL Y-8282 / UCD 70-5) TaxID=1071381 RepID=G8BQV4_TETPH|nr:hypothetical protein TPHA_0C04660 [Tetrapisispora phaffii CBS 4417]CCE62616.1 hypothetical protein TPHA_0C04660 [Tetrapisispora phaffii CBS 4417]
MFFSNGLVMRRFGKLSGTLTRGITLQNVTVGSFRRWHSIAAEAKFKELNPSIVQKAKQHCLDMKAMETEMYNGVVFDDNRQKLFARISSISDSYQKYNDNLELYKGLLDMMKTDLSLKEDAEKELEELLPELNASSNVLLQKLLPPHEFADKPCIVELRPGVGGIEAMIFAQDLLNMYIGFCNANKWKHHIITKNENESGNGIVDAILSIDEPGSYDIIRMEVGVHRVQRIPATETKGRVHTSTAAVVVLPKLSDGSEKESADYERTFKPDDIRIDVMRARGKGGQHVNTTDSAVRLTHFPSGIVVSMQDERSQHKNKAKAFTILRAKLAERERLEKEANERNIRKDQVTTIDRSDKIRTYNYPQNRVTDHRNGLTLYALDAVITGERLSEVIEAQTRHDADLRANQLLNEPISTE